MAFRYVVVTPSGEKLAGTLEVQTVAAAEESLWRSGYTIVSLKKSAQLPSRYELLPSLFRVKPRHIVAFSRQLSTLLVSGLTITSALVAIGHRGGNALFKKTIQKVREDLEIGESFSEACAKHPKVFPPIFTRLVHIGESTGKLEPMLLRAATYLEKQGVLASRIRKALTYPAFVLVSGLAAVYVLLTFSIPALSGLFSEYGADLPATTRLVIAMGDVADSYGKQAGMVILALVVAGFIYFGSSQGKRVRDRMALRTPVIKRIMGGEAISRMGYTLATLLSAGVGFSEAIELLITTTGNSSMKEALAETKKDVLTGQNLSHSIARQKVFPPLVSEMISIGEETGRLDTNLNLLGEFYEKETEESVATLTALIEPAAIIGVGGFVGFIAVVMMSSIYGIIKQIGA